MAELDDPGNGDGADAAMRDGERLTAEYARRAADADLQNYYARIRPALERSIAARREQVLRLLDGLGSRESLEVLDVGCGEGGDLRYLADAGCRPTNLAGVDLLERDVQRARELVPGAQISSLNASALPVDSGSFDAVIQVTALSSLVDRRARAAVASEMARVCRPGGLVISYDLRRAGRNEHLVDVDEAELERLFGRFGEMTCETVQLDLRLASRLPRPATIILERLPPLRSHILAVIRRSDDGALSSS